jgi:hypothetical protein
MFKEPLAFKAREDSVSNAVDCSIISYTIVD